MATISSAPSAPTTGTLDLTAGWLIDPSGPTAVRLRVRDWGQVEQPAEQGVFDPIGSTTAIVVDGVRQAARSNSLLLHLPDKASRQAIAALLDPPRTLLLQIPADDPDETGEQHWIRPVYPIVTTRVLTGVASSRRWLQLGWVAVEAPPVTG